MSGIVSKLRYRPPGALPGEEEGIIIFSLLYYLYTNLISVYYSHLVYNSHISYFYINLISVISLFITLICIIHKHTSL